MRRHWQKKPLLVRGAMPGFKPLLSRAQLFALAGREEVESRLIVHVPGSGWTLEQGPFKKRAFPPFRQRGWTLLVQGVDLHDDGAHALLQAFRFVPDARLDDLMISWASEGGGVGPHFDSYDVFLLQAQGRRRWRIGRPRDLSFVEGAPLKILRCFVAEQEYVLEPGDMLYLPPKWAHEGVADGGECMTYSLGLHAPERGALARDMLERLAEEHEDNVLYRDPQQAATRQPGRIPPGLQAFAVDAVRDVVERPRALTRALGEVLTEPKPHVRFEPCATPWIPGAVVLDRRTRMMYDEHHVFINGEANRARGRALGILRRLADERRLDARAVCSAGGAVQAFLGAWFGAGWLHSPGD
jgi:50S ribosomal protein L16 3-hydroxylase